MEFNPEISKILSEFNIDKDAGHLVLLGIYYELNVIAVVPEAIWKAINLTKIVELNFEEEITKSNNNNIIWNVSLFKDEEPAAWEWVREWNSKYSQSNPARKGAFKDVLKRMKIFFSENPEYRIEDIVRASQAYIRSLSSPIYLKDSAAFIFEGAGKNRKSQLLKWCELTKNSPNNNNNEQRGKILS